MCIYPLAAIPFFWFASLQTLTAQESTRADFKKLVDQLSGAWLGNTTAADQMFWNSQKRKSASKVGRLMPGYVKVVPIMDGHALQISVRVADGAHRYLIFFDPATMQMRLISVHQRGVLHDEQITFGDGVWKFSGTMI